MPPRDGSPDEAEVKLRWADRLGAFLTSTPKWIALAVVAWQARLSIEALAGKNGLASFLARFNQQTTTWELVCWLAAVAGIVYGLYSRFLLRGLQRGAVPRRGALLEARERARRTAP
jgi:hypothetical protein